MSGVFGKEIKETLGLLEQLPPEHAFWANELPNVLIDRNLRAEDGENSSPAALKSLLFSTPAMSRETTWVRHDALSFSYSEDNIVNVTVAKHAKDIQRTFV